MKGSQNIWTQNQPVAEYVARLNAAQQSEAPGKWLDELPLASSRYSGMVVAGVLHELPTHFGVKAERCVDTLERLREIALAAGASRECRAATLPLETEFRHAVRATDWLQLELARAWSRLAAELCADVRKADHDLMTHVIARALSAWHDAQQFRARLYHLPPRHFWGSVYALFGLAELYGVSRNGARNDNLPILSRFRRILLLSLAGTGHYCREDLDWLNGALGQYEGLAKLAPTNPNPRGPVDGVFVLDFKFDAPPRRYTPTTPTPSEPYWLLTRPLVDELTTDAAAGGISPVDAYRMRRLARVLVLPARRKSARNPAQYDTRGAVVGMESILSLLSDSVQGRFRSDATANSIRAQQSVQVTDGWVIPRVGAQTPGDGGRRVAFRSGERAERSEAEIETSLNEQYHSFRREDIWPEEGESEALGIAVVVEPTTVLNVNAHGCCLEWRDEKGSTLRVGEIIALARPNLDLQIGVVRWMDYAGMRNLTFGIEYLGSRPELVHVAFANAYDRGEKAIFLPADENLDKPPSLLVPSGRFRSGDWLLMERSDSRWRLHLRRAVEWTARADHFQMDNMTSVQVKMPIA
ncbi:MAG TPA: hypothetical protein VI457_07695 [Methylococcaceae bacterium]|nr:hypothetical protein [Methylococcaceae bacterium]